MSRRVMARHVVRKHPWVKNLARPFPWQPEPLQPACKPGYSQRVEQARSMVFDDEPVCVICSTELGDEDLTEMTCGHRFHKLCTDTLMAAANETEIDFECPVCVGPKASEKDEEEATKKGKKNATEKGATPAVAKMDNKDATEKSKKAAAAEASSRAPAQPTAAEVSEDKKATEDTAEAKAKEEGTKPVAAGAGAAVDYENEFFSGDEAETGLASVGKGVVDCPPFAVPEVYCSTCGGMTEL